MDFVLQRDETVVPLEIKSGTAGSLRALHQFMAAKAGRQAYRADTNLPSTQRVSTTIQAPSGQTTVNYDLRGLPLYLLAGRGWMA